MIKLRIPQKIKGAFCRFFRKSDGRRCGLRSETEKKPQIKPLDPDSFSDAVEFALKAAGISAECSGIGVALANDPGGARGFIDYICPRFKRVSIYSDDSAAEDIADEIYARFGLPAEVRDSSGFARCRHPLTADLRNGRLRVGRDLCIIGTDENGGLVRG